MADMLGIACSTFRKFVSNGDLPKGRKIGGLRLWKCQEVFDALDGIEPSPFNEDDEGDPILEAINGKKKETRRATA